MNAELERAIQYRDEALTGTNDSGDALMALMGWADWAAEVEMISEAAGGIRTDRRKV